MWAVLQCWVCLKVVCGCGVGKVMEINKRRKNSENVSVEFNDETYGKTWGHF